jgi:hypothetical protein
MKQATIQQPLLNNSSSNKHVSTAMREHTNNETDVFYEVCAEVFYPGPTGSCRELLGFSHCELLL